jgi:hypothetical protein
MRQTCPPVRDKPACTLEAQNPCAVEREEGCALGVGASQRIQPPRLALLPSVTPSPIKATLSVARLHRAGAGRTVPKPASGLLLNQPPSPRTDIEQRAPLKQPTWGHEHLHSIAELSPSSSAGRIDLHSGRTGMMDVREAQALAMTLAAPTMAMDPRSAGGPERCPSWSRKDAPL